MQKRKTAFSIHIHDEHLYLLAWAAGCLNALTFLGLGNVFSTNMTGNTVLLSMALAGGDEPAALRSGIALCGFCLGVFVGALCIEWRQAQAKWTPHRLLVLRLDDGLLAVFTTIWLVVGVRPNPGFTWLLLGISTFAMGVQSTLALSLAFPGVATTYFTGTLTNLMAGAARLFHMQARTGPDPDAHALAEERKEEHSLGRLALMWFMYALAAYVNSVLFEHFPLAAICFPLATNVLVLCDVLIRKRLQHD